MAGGGENTRDRGGAAGGRGKGRGPGKPGSGGDTGRGGGSGGKSGDRCSETIDWVDAPEGELRPASPVAREGGAAGDGADSAGTRQAAGGPVVPLFGWGREAETQPDTETAVMAAHVASIAAPPPRALADQIDALSWAERCCDRVARDAADEADRCASLSGNDRRFAAAELMADRVRALRYLRTTLEAVQAGRELATGHDIDKLRAAIRDAREKR